MPTPSLAQLLEAALAHHEAGEFEPAEELYQRILEQAPEHPDALHLRGVLAYQSGRNDAAIKLIERAIAASPQNAAYHSNLGNALRNAGREAEAVASYQRAIALKPGFAQAHINLGLVLKTQGLFDEAIAAYQQALAVTPDNPRIWNSLGNAYAAKARLDDALAAYRRALALQPDFVEARNNLGIALKNVGSLDEAVACYREALALAPASASFHSNLIFTLAYHPAYDAATIAAEQRQWNQRHAMPLATHPRAHDNTPEPERRLRLGYVSPDFHAHAAACYLVPLLESHNHHDFEIHCYSSVSRPDAITRRLAQAADHWYDVRAFDDEKLAEQIRRDRTDILVDLSLHMGQNRLLLFARKPAPVQVTWLAYPGSTGLDAIDYRMTDPHLDPPGLFDQLCSENLRAPAGFLLVLRPAFDRTAGQRASREEIGRGHLRLAEQSVQDQRRRSPPLGQSLAQRGKLPAAAAGTRRQLSATAHQPVGSRRNCPGSNPVCELPAPGNLSGTLPPD